MEEKVLIYFDENKLKPCGGPAGYLYNLRTELVKKHVDNIEFLKGSPGFRKKKEIFKKLPKVFQNWYHIAKRINWVKALKQGNSGKKISDLEQYGILHFHDTFSLYQNKNVLKEYKGKVIVQSHSPKPYHLEMMDKARGIEKWYYKRNAEFLKSVEEYAFNSADYIVFPCPEAEEPYYNNMDIYKKIHEKNIDKYRYILTGINDIQIKAADLRKRYGIPEEAFVIVYAGRHNETKGYDILKQMGQKILDKYPDVYFVIAGKEEPLTGLKHDRWIEIGWTNNPHGVIAEGDLFILPNRETYFDLIMLEVLAIGKIVLASNTGGNKFFAKYKSAEISRYDSIPEAFKYVETYHGMSKEERKEKEKNNRELFVENFTSDIFCGNYLELLERISSEEREQHE